MRRRPRDSGAAAVELALVLPILMLLSFGIISFGYAFHVQTLLDNAARDAVRIFVLTDGTHAAAEAAAASRADESLAGTAAGGATLQPIASCTLGANARAVVRLDDVPLFGGLFGPSIDLEGSGTMRCNG
ncbi:TadE family protein [Agrococcus sp. SCSIO52902]|uniref:TadE family protein n=1 Tax=Agrococcus sp. SCSIO52902 TaxID=2933290 RepID=UPI001FF6EF77|nr:TadE family protein [Agrococcus sp. SCSIO52902]UOW00018.1 pilus assembly protein [Agrococcus sp. SCSIO52902]